MTWLLPAAQVGLFWLAGFLIGRLARLHPPGARGGTVVVILVGTLLAVGGCGASAVTTDFHPVGIPLLTLLSGGAAYAGLTVGEGADPGAGGPAAPTKP